MKLLTVPLLLAAPVPLLAQSVSMVLVDFGSTSLTSDSSTYNNITTDSGSWSIADLVNSDGSASGAALTYSLATTPSTKTEGIAGLDQDGFLWDSSATRDSLFHSSTTELMTMSLTGLSDGQEYEFAFFGDRNAYSTYRPTIYSVTIGSTTELDWANITHNGDSGPADIAIVNIVADATGSASIEIGPGAGSDGQYHINVMQITAVTAVPEPSAFASLLGLVALGLIARRKRR